MRLQKQKIKKFKTTKRKKRKKFHVKQVVYSGESVFVKELHGFLDIALKLQKVNFGVFHVKQTQKNLFHIKKHLEMQILAGKAVFLLLFCFFISKYCFYAKSFTWNNVLTKANHVVFLLPTRKFHVKHSSNCVKNGWADLFMLQFWWKNVFWTWFCCYWWGF